MLAASPFSSRRDNGALVGVNYRCTEGELKGYYNDGARMRRCLVDRFGFDEAGIRVLLDADPAKPQPTGANIRRNSSGSSGTRSFFHFNGHGLR
ncbi:hypothetical protein PR202_ga31557 [Eleusine coracana subsp. coracana]|uniref:Uncharacterized protein n=1 Tax=Eleusine coracana subsp. coracana TaxID=191504 RepID=A0AAV5DSK6_ELECO|nr:hypothetical protein PR202_ga31557 [Eleusine coracana subsp. coracana]